MCRRRRTTFSVTSHWVLARPLERRRKRHTGFLGGDRLPWGASSIARADMSATSAGRESVQWVPASFVKLPPQDHAHPRPQASDRKPSPAPDHAELNPRDHNASGRKPRERPGPGPRKTQAAGTAKPPAAHPHQRPAAGPRAFRPKGRSASGRRATQCVQAQDRIAASSRTARSAPSHTADGRVGCCRANADLQAAQKGPRRGVIGPRGT